MSRWSRWVGLILCAGLVGALGCSKRGYVRATPEEKDHFIRMVPELPHEGEFLTEEGTRMAEPYLPVLLGLTEEDLRGRDLYQFLAVSRALCNKKQHQDYVIQNFQDIRHWQIKLGWGVMLFNETRATPEIVAALRTALRVPEQAVFLDELTGPHSEQFRRALGTSPN